MTRTFVLDAEFADGNGKSRHLKLKHFDPTKTADQIKTALVKLTKLDLFEKDGVALYKRALKARVIETTVRTIFDDEEAADVQSVAEVVPEKMPSPESVEMTEAAETTDAPEHLRIPDDFKIIEEHPKPGWLIQTIELPQGVEPQDISESQACMLIAACLPPRVTVEDLDIDEQARPAKLIITAKYEETPDEPVLSVNKESPPAKPKKKRKRLIDRIRKRE